MSWPHFERFSDERPGRHNVSVWPQINGKPATEPFAPADLRGRQAITILLGQRPEPGTPPIHPAQ